MYYRLSEIGIVTTVPCITISHQEASRVPMGCRVQLQTNYEIYYILSNVIQEQID